MSAAFEVHNVLGGGLAEEIYQESMEIELALQGISFKTKPSIECHYKNTKLQKKYQPDLITHAAIVVELKAVNKLLPEHLAQLMNYMRITKIKVGYLINFGPAEKLEWKRVVLN